MLPTQTWTPCKQLQHLEQSGLQGFASQEVLSGQGVGIFSIFPKFEAAPISVDKLRIQWTKENEYARIWTFIYETGKHRFQAQLQLFLSISHFPRTVIIKLPFWS